MKKQQQEHAIKYDLQDKSIFGKIKSWIGCIFYFYGQYVFSIAFYLYLVYEAIQGQDQYALILLIIITTFQFFIASKSDLFIALIKWLNIPNYFDEWTCTLEESIQPEKSFIAFHPHAIFNFSFFWNSNHHFYNIIPLGSRVMFFLPILGLFVRLYGCQSVNSSNMRRLMKEGKNIGILPGGFEEASLTNENENRVFIKNRKGFIKYCLQYGYTIYPAYGFGENKSYWMLKQFQSFRTALSKMKIPSVFFCSRFGLLPNPNTRINTVVGKGIELPLIDNPTNQDIDKYHQIYQNELLRIFNTYKKQFNEEDQQLVLY